MPPSDNLGGMHNGQLTRIIEACQFLRWNHDASTLCRNQWNCREGITKSQRRKNYSVRSRHSSTTLVEQRELADSKTADGKICDVSFDGLVILFGPDVRKTLIAPQRELAIASLLKNSAARFFSEMSVK